MGIAAVAHPATTVAATRLFTWNTVAPSPIKRFESQGLAVNGKLYVFGGFYNTDIQATTRVDVYDLATNTWAQLADMPEPITHAGQVVDGNTIYIVGGYLGNSPGPSIDHVWKYDIVSNSWSAGPSLPAARGGGGAARVGRSLHFIGGATRGTTVESAVDQSDHFVLNLDGGTSWTQAAPIPNPRNHIATVVLNGKIYAIGGQHRGNEDTENQEQVDVYDPATDSWTRAANLPRSRSHTGSSTFTMANHIITIGGSGSDSNGSVPLADATLYDPQTDVWIALPALPGGRKTPVAGAIGEQIVVSTGNGGGPTETTWVGALQNSWEQASELPVALGEVAGGIIGNTLYVVGEGNAATLKYNLSTNSWESNSTLSERPFVGDHHAAEVINGKLYLFGGLGSGAGKVQIYDPTTDQWTLGADMPFAAGSSASALINGDVYVAGGVVNGATTTQVAKYNPTSNTWVNLAPMPQGRNHAAAATDGSKIYIFGGRGPGSGDDNVVANGFDTVQIYDPATNTWVSSLDAGSTLAPLPQARGGMGKGVYVEGEFYVMGGETLTGAGATPDNVYDRVDIYNPQTNSWRLGTALPTARHGIFPLQIAGRIYVAGGGGKAARARSTLLEVYNAGTFNGTQEPAPTLTASPYQTATAATATKGAWLASSRLLLPFVAGGRGASIGGVATTLPTTTVIPPRTPSNEPIQRDEATTATIATADASASPSATAITTATNGSNRTPVATTMPTETTTPTTIPQSGFTSINWSTVAGQGGDASTFFRTALSLPLSDQTESNNASSAFICR